MSTKKKMPARRAPARRGRGRRMWIPPEDDIPLSLLAFFAGQPPKNRRKSTPRKKPLTRARAAPAAAASADVINLDDTPETLDMVHSVNSKIGNFMQTGSFISSDEEETEMIKAKTNKKPSPNPFFISDDSDDDCKVTKNPSTSLDLDFSTPSTSAGTSRNPNKDNNSEALHDDIMDIVDSVLDKKGTEQSPLKDMKSLEDYRKETEEMLKNASSLLDEIKTGRKPEPVVEKIEESSPSVKVGACPVCLESLVNRAAAVTVCGHIFCKECIMQTAQSMKKCPTCRKAINSKKIHPIYF